MRPADKHRPTPRTPPEWDQRLDSIESNTPLVGAYQSDITKKWGERTERRKRRKEEDPVGISDVLVVAKTL